MPAARAKFTCVEKTQNLGAKNAVISCSLLFSPIFSDDQSSKEYTSWRSGGGPMQIVITEQTTADLFEVGKDYYLDFSAA